MTEAPERSPIRVTVLQDVILHYRASFFRGLASLPDIDLTLASHEVKTDLIDRGTVEPIEITRLSGVYLYKNVDRLCRDADVIITPFSSRRLDLPWMISKYRERIILWGHGYGRSRLSPISNRYMHALCTRAAAILLYEERSLAPFLQSGLRAEKCFFNGNTIAVDGDRQAIDNTGRKNFVFVGSLIEAKDVRTLVEAFLAALPQLPQDVGLSIVGDGPDREGLEMLACRSDAQDRVRFHGFLSLEDAGEVLKTALAYVSPGYAGLGILHAFAFGAPVVLFDMAHPPEALNVRDGETGLVLPKGDKKEILTQALIALANDPAQAARMGQTAQAWFETERSMERMIERTADCIRYVHRNRGQAEC